MTDNAPESLEHEDREEQDLVLLTEVSRSFIPSPAKSASTKDSSFATDPDYDYDLEFKSGGNDEALDPLSEIAARKELNKLDDSYYPADPEHGMAFGKEEDRHQRSSRKTKLMGVGVLCLLVIVAVVVVVVLVLTVGGDGQKDEPIEAQGSAVVPSIAPASLGPTPVPPPSFERIAARLFDSPDDYPQDSGAPSYQAIAFLADEHTATGLEYEERRLTQRYGLATIFFSLGGPTWTESLGFLSQKHECYWNQVDNSLITGAVCTENDGLIRYLSLPSNNLQGTIPEEVSFLPKLFHFDVSSNTIGGSLPEAFESLVEMKRLSLNRNELTGTISSTLLSSWPQLEYLSLERNYLTGNIDALCDLDHDPVLRADCLGNDKEVECACCNVCCSIQDQCGAKP